MRVLVTAASKHGATSEIADAIADELRSAGLEADTREPHDVRTVEGYDALVLGSGAYYGHWLKEAKEFAERIESELGDRPVWIFTSGPIGDPPKPDDEPPDVAEVVEATHAREHPVFAGRIRRKGLGPLERTIISAMHVKETDNRDWAEIRAWAREIARQLSGSPAPT